MTPTPGPDPDPASVSSLGPGPGPGPGPAAAALSAVEIAAAVRSRTLHAVDVVAEALERIEQADPALSAFIEVWGEDALRRAGEVDARVVAGERLPLAGVPIGVKGRRGLRTAGPLLAAGCVPVGATSVPGPGTPWQTWGLGRYGRTVNPWRHDRTPGGSSAGSAAAVAAGLIPLATGSDGAGSVRIPAAWCGVIGLKAGNGRLPSTDRTGLMAPGVLARCVADAAAYWSVVSGEEADADRPPGSGGYGSLTGPPDRSPYDSLAGPVDPGPYDSLTGSPDRSPYDSLTGPPDRSPYDSLAGPVDPGPYDSLTGSPGPGPFDSLAGPPDPAPHNKADRPDVPTAVWSPDLGFDAPDPDVVAVAHAAAVRLAEAGAVRLVRPRTPLRLDDPAPAWLALRSPGAASASASAPADPDIHRLRAANDDRLADLFTEIRLLLTPTAPTPPHGHAGPGDRYSTALTWAFNLSGHPAISIPAGFGPDGCPVGLQLVAAHGAESLLLAVAGAAEKHIGPWPIVSAI
ncbi:amidase [Streptomyces sp. NPDC048558]|uniref:amidase n=1 Tax=Streptomyces sp. NPDC048558 TaxID=3155759 RepID=UPI00342B3D52